MSAKRAEIGSEEQRREIFSTMLAEAIAKSDKSQHEISESAGYKNANIITMFKQGRTRVPLSKVVVLATTLNEDPAKWLRAWFEAYEPNALTDIENHMGFPMSFKERSWIRGLRKHFGTDGIPSFDLKLFGRTSELKAA